MGQIGCSHGVLSYGLPTGVAIIIKLLFAPLTIVIMFQLSTVSLALLLACLSLAIGIANLSISH